MIEGSIEGCNMEGVSLRNAGLHCLSLIGSTILRNANLEGCTGEISMINVDLTGTIGFNKSILGGGYAKLTLPNGRFIDDWDTEQI